MKNQIRQGIVAESPKWAALCAAGLAANSPVPAPREAGRQKIVKMNYLAGRIES